MGVEVSRLSNGLTVATETIPNLRIRRPWASGSNRAPATSATTSTAWRICSNTWRSRAPARRSAFEIASEIENVGGEINAATSVETTSYYARVLSDDVPLAVDILADILTEFRVRRRGTGARAACDPAGDRRRPRHARRRRLRPFHRDRLPPPDDRPLDPRHAGNGEVLHLEAVARLHRPAIRRRAHGRRWRPATSSTTISCARSRSQLRRLPQPAPTAPPPQYAHYVGGDFREDRDLMDAQIILGFEGRAYHVRDFYASQVLSMILGGGMSSRLFQEVREKRGLCYSVYAFHWGFSDTGIFGVHAATGQSDIAELVPVIIDELQKAGESILQEELDRARAQYRAGLIMSAESAASRASQIARQLLLFGRPIAKEELMERLVGADRRAADRPLVAPVFDARRPSPRSGRSGRSLRTRRSATRFPGTRCHRPQARGLNTCQAPCSRSLSSAATSPALKGERVTLRLPRAGRLPRVGSAAGRRKPQLPGAVGAALGRRRARPDRLAPAPRALPRGLRAGHGGAVLHFRERRRTRWSAASRSATSATASRRPGRSATGWASAMPAAA